MQALKANKKISKSHEGTGTVPGVPNEANGAFKAKADSAIDWGSENKSDYSKEDKVDEEIEWLTTDEEEEKQDDQDDDDDRSIDIVKTDDEEVTNDEYVHGDEYVHDDVDEEMKDGEDAKDVETGNDDEETTDAEKTDAEKTEVTKGDLKQARKLPLTSSSLSVSFGFGNQFLNLSSDASFISTTKESADTEINSLLDIHIQQEVPQIQYPTLLNVPVSVIPEPPVSTPTLTLSTVTPVLMVSQPPPIVFAISYVKQQTTPIPSPPITTIAPSITTIVPDPLPAIVQRVFELEKDVQELKQADHSPAILKTIRS
ncbi:hypothetical protein Tco_0960048 [Tanacetum coccineum]